MATVERIRLDMTASYSFILLYFRLTPIHRTSKIIENISYYVGICVYYSILRNMSYFASLDRPMN